jgi:prepilin-type N-terminal cleavage/methylation domain-containing protein/prepilin-type processing-associated H-X9-DG protein
MIYIHKMPHGLSSNLAPASDFPFRSLPGTNIVECYATGSMTRNFYLARAFTLIELLVVIAVIAILGTIAYPVFIGTQERAKVTKDMSNLRQIGLATQTYMNDNDGTVFSTSAPTWMSRLEGNQKYLSAWGVLQSPFDARSPSETGTVAPVSRVSYGINSNSVGITADRISKPTAFILFAPAQASGLTVTFQGDAVSAIPGVTVLGIGSTTANTATSTPGGNATRGTQNNRNRINALFADLHAETMDWTRFTNDAATANDPDGQYRWNPVPTPSPAPTP